MYKYKISVIIPVYNTEQYLEECLDSVAKQTIGIKNIQVILINDGSPDNSEEICLKYKDKYPNNITYIKQENAGVSAARNKALEYVEGKYVGFLDSDDKWNLDAYKKLYKYLDKHQKEIDFVTCKMLFFGGKTGGHVLNYKFKKTMIVDIEKNYDFPQLSMCSALFKSEVLKDYRFNPKIKYEEDALLINHIIQNKMKYGVVSNTCMWYRKTVSSTSASQTATKKEGWYTDTVEECYKNLFKESKEKYGKVLRFYQYYVMYSLQWRIPLHQTSLDNPDLVKIYRKNILMLLKDIDSDIILEQKNMGDIYKILSLENKYAISNKNVIVDDDNLNIQDTKIRLTDFSGCQIDTMYFYEDKVILYGKYDDILVDAKKELYFIDTNKKKYKIETYELGGEQTIEDFNMKKVSYTGFKVILPIHNTTYKAILKNGKKEIVVPIKYLGSTPLHVSLPNKTYKYNKYIFEDKYYDLTIYKSKILTRFIKEVKNQLFLLRQKKIRQFLYRIIGFYIRPLCNKNIWLISDRINMANDNGESFFRYIIKNKKKIKAYFVISKKSPDYARIKKIGKVVDNSSHKYKFLHLVSSDIISSHAEGYITNFAGNSGIYIRDLYQFKYTFLQHGTTKDDISPWLNVNSKKIDLFVMSVKKEYDSMFQYHYNYPKNVIQLTGFPRFDRLNSGEYQKQNKVLLMPTWRKGLASTINVKTGERLYNEEFKESDFFKFYNKLINDEKLISTLKNKNYKLKFCCHPNMLVQMPDFNINEYVEIVGTSVQYSKEFQECSMLITDYSSVFFDVAYLKKPVVYAHFDQKEFFEQQIYNQGYFDYEKDGFGPVCYNYEDTLKAIVNIINNDCKMDDKYEKRVNSSYGKNNNITHCEKVYNKIMAMK